MIKGTDNSQKTRYIGQGLEGPRVQELLSPWSWGASPSQHVDVLTEPCTLGIFM